MVGKQPCGGVGVERYSIAAAEEALAAQAHVVELEETLCVVVGQGAAFGPPVGGAAGGDGQLLAIGDVEAHGDGNACGIVDARACGGGLVAAEGDGAPFPRCNHSAQLVGPAGKAGHGLLHAQARCPPLVGVHQIVAVLARHPILAGLEFVVAIRVFANQCPAGLVAGLERRVGDAGCGIDGRVLAGRLQQRVALCHEVCLGNTEQAVVAGLVAAGVEAVQGYGLTVGDLVGRPGAHISFPLGIARHGIFPVLEQPIAVLVGRYQIAPVAQGRLGIGENVHITRKVVGLEQA